MSKLWGDYCIEDVGKFEPIKMDVARLMEIEDDSDLIYILNSGMFEFVGGTNAFDMVKDRLKNINKTMK